MYRIQGLQGRTVKFGDPEQFPLTNPTRKENEDGDPILV